MTTIVVGVNNQATALAAFTRAKSHAQLTDADLHLVYAVDVGDAAAEATARRHAEVPAQVLRHAMCSVLVVDTASASTTAKDSSPSKPFG